MNKRGDPRGYFSIDALDRSSPEALVASVEREFLRVSDAFELAVARLIEFHSREPEKPREGMIAGADGVGWDPGDGKGIYVFYTGVWNSMLTVSDGGTLYEPLGTIDTHEAAANPHPAYLTQSEADALYDTDTAVVPGAYINANITVNQKGRITAAANGAAGSGSIASNTVDAVEVLTAAEYAALSPPNPTTIYYVLQ